VNDSKEENLISGNFFIPIDEKAKIIAGATGQSCNLKTLLCKPFVKTDGTTFSSDRKNCDCCLVV